MPTVDSPSDPARTPRLADVADDLAHSLGALPALLTAPEPLTDTLARVAVLCCQTLPECDHAAILVRREDGSVEAAASSEGPRYRLDQVQVDAGRGPCIDALEGETVVYATLPDDRWPEFSSEAKDAGIRSSLAVPVPPHGDPSGSLNLFSHRPDALGELHELVATMFAAQCALAIAGHRARERALAISDQMGQALESRAVIDQAKGVIMAREACDADAAFALLVQRSQRENRKLREVAAAVVDEAIRGT